MVRREKQLHRALREVLRGIRQEKGLAQYKVSRRCRRPRNFASKYETGARRILVVDFLQITRALKVDPCEILRRVKARRAEYWAQ